MTGELAADRTAGLGGNGTWYVAPLVRADVLSGGPAHLLWWERMATGQWGARIAWIEVIAQGACIVRGGTVPKGAVQPIEGEDYSAVRRDRRPRDRSDPRDPGPGDPDGMWSVRLAREDRRRSDRQAPGWKPATAAGSHAA